MESSETERKLTSIEARLALIEAQLGKSTPQAAPHQSPVPKPVAAVQVIPHPVFQSTTTTLIPELAGAGSIKSGNWLGIIAVLCFVLAAGLIIKLSIDSGWLTPTRQIGLAAMLGFGLIGAGFALLKSDRDYASYLPGAGIIVLYLTSFAAHRYYNLISFEAALAMAVVISGLCIWIYTRILNELYPLIAAVGTYLAPLILNMHLNHAFPLYYFLICSVAFTVISIGLQSRLLTVVASYLAIGVTTLIGLALFQEHVVTAWVLAGHFVIFSAGTYLYSRRVGTPLSDVEAWAFLPVLLLF